MIINSITGLGIGCPILELSGFYCPGCGVTRMIKSILIGNFKQAFFYNQLLFISTPIFIYLTIDYMYSNYKEKTPLINKIPNKVYYAYIAILIIFGIIRNIFPYFAPTNI